MKNVKHTLVIVLVLGLTFIITRSNINDYLLKILILFTISLIIFNLSFRKSLFLKKYFTSKYNVLTSKFRSEKVYDISEELMFEKVVEVINNSNLKIATADKLKLEILAITPITFTSWGESLYINFDSSTNGCVMHFCSVVPFGMYSWGKNEINSEYVLKKIEDSFTI